MVQETPVSIVSVGTWLKDNGGKEWVQGGNVIASGCGHVLIGTMAQKMTKLSRETVKGEFDIAGAIFLEKDIVERERERERERESIIVLEARGAYGVL